MSNTNQRNSIIDVLMRRDGLSLQDAQAQVWEAQEILGHYLETGQQDRALDICEEQFGLEPDFLQSLLEGMI